MNVGSTKFEDRFLVILQLTLHCGVPDLDHGLNCSKQKLTADWQLFSYEVHFLRKMHVKSVTEIYSWRSDDPLGGIVTVRSGYERPER
jgi:hypothetical protein